MFGLFFSFLLTSQTQSIFHKRTIYYSFAVFESFAPFLLFFGCRDRVLIRVRIETSFFLVFVLRFIRIRWMLNTFESTENKTQNRLTFSKNTQRFRLPSERVCVLRIRTD